MYSLLAQTEGEKKVFFWKGAIIKQRRTTLQDYNLVDIRHEKVCPFVKFEIILTPPLFFTRSPHK